MSNVISAVAIRLFLVCSFSYAVTRAFAALLTAETAAAVIVLTADSAVAIFDGGLVGDVNYLPF